MEIHHKVAGVILRDRKFLMVRKYDEPHFIMPGGRMKPGEEPLECLTRELKEELGVELMSLKKFDTYEAPHFRDKNKLIRMETYRVTVCGNPNPQAEINEMQWVDSHYAERGLKLASIDQDFLVPALREKGYID